MKALRQHVERIVRPLRAAGRTKDRMREDLYAHLDALYQEALSRGAGEAAAADQAMRRLGEPGELRRALQASVSRFEQWATWPAPGMRWSQRRAGETIGHWILRTSTAGSLAFAASIGLMAVVLAWIGKRPGRQPSVGALAVVPVLMWFSLVSQFWICELIRRELDEPVSSVSRGARRLRIAGLGALSIAAGAVPPAVGAVMIYWMIGDALFTNTEAVFVSLGWALFMGALMVLQVRDWRTTVRRYDQWESLDLEHDAA